MQYSPPQYLEEVYNRRRLNFEEMLKSDCKNLKRCTLSDKILAEDKGRQGMYFRRKAYDQLLAWKKDYADSYAKLIEGARRVGKTTLAEEFAKNEYSSYILLDFANVSDTVTSCFDDVHDLDMFFLRLQAATGIDLIKNDSVIIFDEIQLFPKARQAIKYLVKDGRFHYIETGSLISIKKNVKDILVPSEEMKLSLYPLDFEEFSLAIGSKTYEHSKTFFMQNIYVDQKLNRQWMRDFRVYMAVGGLPQAVKAFVEGRSFSEIDKVKRSIIQLYEDDFRKIDPSGRISAMFHSIPAQLSRDTKRFLISDALGKRKNKSDENLIYDLVDSKTVLISHNTTDPRVSLSSTKSLDSYKLYLADTGLFLTLMFTDRPEIQNNLYSKMLSDKLPANLGYLYENAVAQVIASSDRELYYHTWEKEKSTHYYEIDFLLSKGTKVSAIEVKSSGQGEYKSLTKFKEKFSQSVEDIILLSQKEINRKGAIKFLPIYMAPFLAERI
jgi:predicted AAA+ superfamily ATPase